MITKYSILLVAATLLATGTQTRATTINDTGSDAYFGARTVSYGIVQASDQDVYGGTTYDITSMDVVYAGNTLSARIHSTYFQYWTNNGGYSPGDLFLSTNGWTPYTAAPGDHYAQDYMGNGTTWEYVIHLSDLQPAGNNGDTDLYKIDEGTINYGETTDGRTAQETSFTPDAGATTFGSGSWQLIGGDGTDNDPFTAMLITMTLPDAFADFDTLGLHWTMSCGNDVVEGEVTSAPVPEPATMLLFGTGLAGLFGASRRRGTQQTD